MTPQNLMLLPISIPKLSIKCPILDGCLGGGIPCNSITKLVKESGSGKMQLCPQLTVRAQLPPSHGGLEGFSIYIFIEFSFSFRRLQRQPLSCIIPQLNRVGGIGRHICS
ncbi:hypothetical protein L3X38_006452 [Prunus dulcis]|uniref:RecA family profile 1 domain-containing protein n=1 Tax=Prunus dulcis TaxID=3755 RepID=A0AAD4ZSN1_PRUDU|nr:hypothetical protein L3X38_006452 [Prunus dulcis]